MAIQAQLHAENMDLPSSMCGLQDWELNPAPALISSLELDSCFNLQDPSGYTIPFHLQQNAHNLGSSSFSLDAHLEMQRQELDSVLQWQNERLISTLREQRKRQLAILLNRMESKALYLMRRKDDELAGATKKRMELEAFLRKAEMESNSWQRLAKEKQTTVMDLSNALQQVKESLVWARNTAEDAESVFSGSFDHQQQGEVEEKSNDNKMVCKHCNTRRSCVVFLPCRHLCSCESCEPFLHSCPVCKSIKEASINVFWV
ncbi:probable BOI-related E3 ubiquitin-protein ligase 2 [Hibiscus syriacus]|uniref:probable BOI-related E3 ubiquitin-protein ligase 2 n=1 Tax=Hibiscus syriacus TaxID=106335 RepID=UPI001923AEE3|nr:probable BOI-related E3 ubiquitin-protein ligase 2 [Hibiscus syriacus]